MRRPKNGKEQWECEKSNRFVRLEFSAMRWGEGVVTQELREEAGPDFVGLSKPG